MKTLKSVSRILVLISALAAQAQAQSFPSDGLVGWYPFTGNANDASGNGNNGIVHGLVLTNDRFGWPSNAYEFIAKGTDIETSNSNGFPFSTNDFTVSFWVNVSSNSGTYQVFICNDAARQFQIQIDAFQGSQTQIRFQTGGTSAASTPLISWALQQWYNVQVLRSQNTNILIYRDGVLLSQLTTTLGNDAAPTMRNLVFGLYSTAAGYIQFYGSMDDIRIYNRALSPAELQQLYQYESKPQVGLIKAVKPFFGNLSFGTNYQLQVSADLNTWTNYGLPFKVTNRIMVYPQYLDVNNWGDLFFRLQTFP